MRNKKAPQTVSARHDAREHLSIEAYHKLNRASAVSQFVGGDLIHRELSGLHQLYIPHIFSYLNEDIDFVLNELKAKGAYFHERRSLNNFHRDRVITFEQIAE
ncbi:Derepression protein [Escherichia coli]|nr:Derepression protein [Escherichia coli]